MTLISVNDVLVLLRPGGKSMSPQTVFDIQARLCKSMGYPIRLEILHSLRDGPKCVNELSELLGQSQSTISRHLSILRSAGIVLADHQRQNIYYRVANPKLLGVCDLMREILEEQSVHETKLAREL
jgi:DNA-binding transcriptional ArsR family regulator